MSYEHAITFVNKNPTVQYNFGGNPNDNFINFIEKKKKILSRFFLLMELICFK